MCKPCVNQILPCANQKQPCVNYFAPYANPQFSAIPTCFAKPSGHTSYFHVLITCRTFPVQSGEVTFWGQKKFTHFITVLPGLPPDGGQGWGRGGRQTRTRQRHGQALPGPARPGPTQPDGCKTGAESESRVPHDSASTSVP